MPLNLLDCRESHQEDLGLLHSNLFPSKAIAVGKDDDHSEEYNGEDEGGMNREEQRATVSRQWEAVISLFNIERGSR